MMPAVELNMGTAIIPVTGVMFLLRALMEGQLLEAARYALPVVGVTVIGCLLAVRWAIDQFNNESVLFRESERWDLRLWLRHLVRDRGETPSVGEAILCGVLILIAGFFANFVVTKIDSVRAFVVVNMVTQIALIAFPALIMAIMLTSNPRKTLSLYWPRWQMIPLAILLAMLLHPLVNWLAIGIQILYPVSDNMRAVIDQALAPLKDQPLWLILLMIAVTPAICEEIAFRGFILAGLRHTGHRWAAIAISSVFFGITHGLLQQSISAACMGLVIGYLVMHSGSLLPGVLFHMTNNALMVIVPNQLPELVEQAPWLSSIVRAEQAALWYHPLLAAVCALAAAGLCYWLSRQPYQKFAEERLQQALDHQSPLPSARPQWRLW